MEMPASYITTSWDDGHPLDFRIAELLSEYRLQGTFYVPMETGNVTMAPAQVRQLSDAFEVGAHTLHHVDLIRTGACEAQREIADSKSWVEEVTGRPCRMFCPPKGRYAPRDLRMIRDAGYSGVRTVELLSVDFPRPTVGLWLMPTTLQAHPHGLAGYARNIAQRAAFSNLWLYILHGRSVDWVELARSLLSEALKRGGVFHLWGHSWELQEEGQWRRLEDVLEFASGFTSQMPALTNSQVCLETGRGPGPPRHPSQ